MKILIINTTIEENNTGRGLNGLDSAMTSELYKAYRCNNTRGCHLHITANHTWDKYTFIDEKDEYIGTFSHMDDIYKSSYLNKKGEYSFCLGNCLVLTHEQWLNKQNPEWKTEPRYQYW
jgi:hypothetical protein